ncbi:MAG: orotidine 5'-phosphate decarboxylase, partial [Promethearchaeota archaeon]
KNLSRFSDFTNLGAVVGATFSQELKKIREIVKNSFILIPGYGIQGAHAKDIKNGFYKNGLGGIVNSSRGIIFAYTRNKKYTPEDFGKAARDEIIDMSKKINKEIGF